MESANSNCTEFTLQICALFDASFCAKSTIIRGDTQKLLVFCLQNEPEKVYSFCTENVTARPDVTLSKEDTSLTEHAFAVCAYKESPYLEACICSLEKQTVSSPIVICTSTPCDFISEIAERHGLPLFVRDGESDIQADWNFAARQVDATWVTIAHQDDIYNEKYVESMMGKIRKSKNAIMAFSDYRPIIHGKISMDRNCRLRRILRSPMRWSLLAKNRFFKKRFLSMGNCISCPSVMYNKELIDGDIFTSKLRYSLDWDTFLKFSYRKERFVYVVKPLVYYRIHSEATSMKYINDNRRVDEDITMFRKFWPSFIVKIIMHFYVKAYQTYKD